MLDEGVAASEAIDTVTRNKILEPDPDIVAATKPFNIREIDTTHIDRTGVTNATLLKTSAEPKPPASVSEVKPVIITGQKMASIPIRESSVSKPIITGQRMATLGKK